MLLVSNQELFFYAALSYLEISEQIFQEEMPNIKSIQKLESNIQVIDSFLVPIRDKNKNIILPQELQHSIRRLDYNENEKIVSLYKKVFLTAIFLHNHSEFNREPFKWDFPDHYLLNQMKTKEFPIERVIRVETIYPLEDYLFLLFNELEAKQYIKPRNYTAIQTVPAPPFRKSIIKGLYPVSGKVQVSDETLKEEITFFVRG